MQRNTAPIDWRQEFASLQQFINGRGGVACVRYAGERCAPNSFVETLTSIYEARICDNESKKDGRSLRIDPANYKVRYLAGIRSEFTRKMKSELPSPVTATPISGSSQISSNNVAGGEQSIETHVHYHAVDNEVSLQVRRDGWIKELCNQLHQFLQDQRFMVILIHGAKDEQAEFWDCLWHGGMSDLVDQGLFLVRMIDSNNTGESEHHRIAHPDCDISLPLELDANRQPHAIEDITMLICRLFPDFSKEKCGSLAHGIVLSHTKDIARLHNQLPGILLDLGRKQAESV